MNETVTISAGQMAGKATRWRREAERALRRGELDGGYQWHEDSRAQRCVTCDCDHDKAVKRNANAARRSPVGTVFVGRRRDIEDGKKMAVRDEMLKMREGIAQSIAKAWEVEQ